MRAAERDISVQKILDEAVDLYFVSGETAFVAQMKHREPRDPTVTPNPNKPEERRMGTAVLIGMNNDYLCKVKGICPECPFRLLLEFDEPQ